MRVRKFYRSKVRLLIANNPNGAELVDNDMACYEKHLQSVLQVNAIEIYLYVHVHVHVFMHVIFIAFSVYHSKHVHLLD